MAEGRIASYLCACLRDRAESPEALRSFHKAWQEYDRSDGRGNGAATRKCRLHRRPGGGEKQNPQPGSGQLQRRPLQVFYGLKSRQSSRANQQSADYFFHQCRHPGTSVRRMRGKGLSASEGKGRWPRAADRMVFTGYPGLGFWFLVSSYPEQLG